MQAISIAALGLTLTAGFATSTLLGLVRRRRRARQALSSIDAHLSERNQLIPGIVQLARRFLPHERPLLDEIGSLRARVACAYDTRQPTDIRDHLEAARSLEFGLMRLFEVGMTHPEMRSSDGFLHAQQAYAQIEGQIDAARSFYNSAAADLDQAITHFPGGIVAPWAGVRALPLYEAPEAPSASP